MKKRKTFIAMALIIAVLLLGVGYAAITNIVLTINGTANITANADFDVTFDVDHTVTGTNATGSYTNETTATMTVNLDSTNTEATAVYKVHNESEELSATLTATVKNVDADLDKYTDITTKLYTDEACTQALAAPIKKDEVAYVKVTATLTSNPAQDVLNKSFTVEITAEPADAN